MLQLVHCPRKEVMEGCQRMNQIAWCQILHDFFFFANPNTTWFTYYWKHQRIKSRESLLRTVKEKTNSPNIQGSNKIHMIPREYCANTHIIMYNQHNLILINIVICRHHLSVLSNYLAAGRNQGLRIVFRFNHLISTTFVRYLCKQSENTV